MRYAFLAVFMLFSTAADAAPRGYTCGLYLRQQFGLPAAFNLARNWLSLPRASLQHGAVVVSSRKGRALGGGPGGHVVKVVEVIDSCTAIVNDNRGTYKRNICKNQLGIVSANQGDWNERHASTSHNPSDRGIRGGASRRQGGVRVGRGNMDSSLGQCSWSRRDDMGSYRYTAEGTRDYGCEYGRSAEYQTGAVSGRRGRS